MKVNILAIGVHPDDVELSCSGTLLKHISLGYTVGILDLTKGELGTRGTPETRVKEAQKAADLLGASFRVNAGMADGFFENNQENKMRIVRVIRKYRPDIVLANAVEDRHPDHGRSAQVVYDACFLAGLLKIGSTDDDGKLQERWRPNALYHYTQDHLLAARMVVDITGFMDKKMETILAFRSQFYNPESTEAASPISGQDFLEYIKARARAYGRQIGVEFAEAYTSTRPIGTSNLFNLI
ncbi:MAG: bacillithiol biosynthesis deacetylase BshB1 [Saprospiraceae bacterium]|nr:bacillithiol biosynthesis deacetylase BshB1 [Saprospiraceae bacterium]